MRDKYTVLGKGQKGSERKQFGDEKKVRKMEAWSALLSTANHSGASPSAWRGYLPKIEGSGMVEIRFLVRIFFMQMGSVLMQLQEICMKIYFYS